MTLSERTKLHCKSVEQGNTKISTRGTLLLIKSKSYLNFERTTLINVVQTLPSDRESPLPPAAPSSGHMCSKKEDAVVLSGAEAGENQKEQRAMERSCESPDRCCLGGINVVRVLSEGCWLCGVATRHPSLRRHERNKSLGSGCYRLFAHRVKNPVLGQQHNVLLVPVCHHQNLPYFPFLLGVARSRHKYPPPGTKCPLMMGQSPVLGQHFGTPGGMAIRPCLHHLAIPNSGPDRSEAQRAPTY